MSLANPYQWSRVPSFKEVIGRSHDVMIKLYSDPEWRERAKAETLAQARDSDFLDGDIDGYYQRTSVDETVHHQALQGLSIADLAAERGMDPLDLMLDLALEDDLATRFSTFPGWTETSSPSWSPIPHGARRPRRRGARRHALRLVLPHLHAALLGARAKALTLEEAIWRMTGQPAELFGLTRRGTLQPGKVADIVAFDPETVGETPLKRVYDFPAGGERLVSDGVGVAHVWVAGVQTFRDGEAIEDAYPGAVVSD